MPPEGSRRGGVIHLNGVALAPRRVTSIDQRTLRRRPHLPIRTVQGGEKEDSAVQTFGVPHRGNGDVHRRPRAGKRRERGGDEDAGNVFYHHRRGSKLHPHLLQEVGQGLHRKHRLLAVASAVQAYHHAVADQQVVAHTLHRGDVAQAHLAARLFLARKR